MNSHDRVLTNDSNLFTVWSCRRFIRFRVTNGKMQNYNKVTVHLHLSFGSQCIRVRLEHCDHGFSFVSLGEATPLALIANALQQKSTPLSFFFFNITTNFTNSTWCGVLKINTTSKNKSSLTEWVITIY